MKQDKVHKAVEDICKLGCIAVNQVIQTLEMGEHVAEAGKLSSAERSELLSELKEIMDVYDKS